MYLLAIQFSIKEGLLKSCIPMSPDNATWFTSLQCTSISMFASLRLKMANKVMTRTLAFLFAEFQRWWGLSFATFSTLLMVKRLQSVNAETTRVVISSSRVLNVLLWPCNGPIIILFKWLNNRLLATRNIHSFQKCDLWLMKVVIPCWYKPWFQTQMVIFTSLYQTSKSPFQPALFSRQWGFFVQKKLLNS